VEIEKMRILVLMAVTGLMFFGCTAIRAMDQEYQKCTNLSDMGLGCGSKGCDASLRERCFYDLAINRSDRSLCEEIDTNGAQYLKEECINKSVP
jgi:hypothetical protein